MAAAIVILGPGLPSLGDFRFRSGVYNWLMHIRSLSQSFRLLAKCILSAALLPAAYSQTIESHTAEIDGVKLHYLTAGHGAPLVRVRDMKVEAGVVLFLWPLILT